ncbi:hypothetical protein [Pseudomonas asturiensis]|uniref:hypothetical protein n=1 Tax=Pseudomonas asturiensis TaxID=1190415 RepID=UPI0011328371|nr:hypothetical protein [Pseudomonas asturiensis]
MTFKLKSDFSARADHETDDSRNPEQNPAFAGLPIGAAIFVAQGEWNEIPTHANIHVPAQCLCWRKGKLKFGIYK